MIAGIDSMVLIYAGVVPAKKKSKPAAESQAIEELRVRAKLLLHMLRKETIILPAIAISELLVPVPTAQKGSVVAVLTQRFICPPFDLKAAAIAAELWARHKELAQDLQYESRHVLKSDSMIVASAQSAGDTDFYTHDKNCRALASLVMNAHELPTKDPSDMFAVDDIRRGEI